MSSATILLIIVLVSLATFALRFSFFLLEEQATMPDIFKRGLRFVPVATLTALVVPALVFQDGQVNLSPGNERLLAGALAAIVAYFSKNVLLTIGVGMATLWVLQWLGA